MALLTEEEARGQVCPLITFCVNEVDVIRQRDAAIHVHQNCQASACRIGWRWGPGGPECGMGFCGAFGAPSLGAVPVAGVETLTSIDEPGAQ